MKSNSNSPEVNNKKERLAWVFYDWANSVYPLVITTAIFPIFFDGLFHDENGNEIMASFFGKELKHTVLITYLTAFYFSIIVILMPILSGIADAGGSKKKFMRFFCYLGSLSCVSLYFFDPNRLELSLLSYMFAGLGFWFSLVFYNAYLPEIAPPEDHDKLSAKGFSMGYFGSVILLVSCLALVMTAADDNKLFMTKISFVITGIWWFGFAHIPLTILKDKKQISPSKGKAVKNGFLEIKKVFKRVRNTTILKKYLSSFFTYSMGVQTLMLVAIYFAQNHIDWGSGEEGAKFKSMGLIISVILIQIIAIPGAFFLSFLSKKIGNISTLQWVTGSWVVICFAAYFISTPLHFFILAAFVGFLMGGTQSLSRSTYAKLVPQDTEDTASFFSFFDISEKIGIVIGMGVYASIELITGDMRFSVLAMAIIFAIGSLLLFRITNSERALLKAENND